MKELKIGKRVKVKSIGIKGKIFYINQPNYYRDHYAPIQVELDHPYDDSGQTMYRTHIKDIVKLKKKKPEESFDFTSKKKKHKETDIVFDFS